MGVVHHLNLLIFKQFFSCIYCRQSRHVSCCMTYNGGHPTGKHFLAAAWYWGTVSHP